MQLFFVVLICIIPAAHNANVTSQRMQDAIEELDIAFDEFPNLEDVVPTLCKKTWFDNGNLSDVMFRNVSIDLDKINIEKFKKRIDGIMDKMAEEEMKPNVSRRQAVLNWEEERDAYIRARDQRSRRKILDLMLQTLYMARHKIKELEANKYFNKKDTGFRIAFTYRRLDRLYRKLLRIYTYANMWRDYWFTPIQQINLHGKAVRIHVDFMYLWWVLIKVDSKYKARTGDKQKELLAKHNKYGDINDIDLKTLPTGYTLPSEGGESTVKDVTPHFNGKK